VTASLTAPDGEQLTDYTAHLVQTRLRELTSGTTYHYALVAENEIGRTVSADQTFTTAAPEPPAPTTAEEQAAPGPNVAALLAPPATIPFAPYTSIAQLNAKEAKEGKTTTPKSLTRTQKLKNALKACHKKRNGRQRHGCEATRQKT
jgi:hypothetical protein